METNLVRYDAANKTLETAQTVAQVKFVIAEAEAIKALAKHAKGVDSEWFKKGNELRLRAERRLGQMMARQAETTGLAKASGSNQHTKKERGIENPIPLEKTGIDKNLAKKARIAAALSDEEFEEHVRERGPALTEVGASQRCSCAPGPTEVDGTRRPGRDWSVAAPVFGAMRRKIAGSFSVV